jgi:S1-C subfamily serine protease
MVISGGLALAVPSRAVQALLARRDSRRRIGVTLRPVRVTERTQGLLILEIEPRSAAERASLLPGDVIVAVNGDAIGYAEDLQQAIDDANAGIVRLMFRRGGDSRIREVAVQIPDRQAATAA